jgi:5-formyltetrahydrofolate cyclo-ligase
MESTPAPSGREELDRAKALVRFRARAARRTVLPEVRIAHAYAIAERMLHLPEIVDASAVMLYGASPEEADPSVLEMALRDLGKRIAYPRVAGGHDLTIHWVDDPDVLVVGAFGLKQPRDGTPTATLGEISAIVVPGIAFDEAGNRLGFGGGYYDTLLEGPGAPPTIGIAYDEQLVDDVPHEDRDRPVDVLVTPTRTIRCATNRS